MLLAALPLIVMLPLLGWNWKAALMIGAATSLSSTVLVFKALAEYGQLETPHGRRAIAILLFQDVALVPLMLLMPMLTGEETCWSGIGRAAGREHGVVPVRSICGTTLHHRLSSLPCWFACGVWNWWSCFPLTVLGLGIGGAHLAGLPPALGALAAGFGAGWQPLERSGGRHDLAVSRVVRGGVLCRPGDSAAAGSFPRTAVAVGCRLTGGADGENGRRRRGLAMHGFELAGGSRYGIGAGSNGRILVRTFFRSDAPGADLRGRTTTGCCLLRWGR